MKIALTVVGMTMLGVSATYTANPGAAFMAYVATVCASVGAYLVGLFQEKPGGPSV